MNRLTNSSPVLDIFHESLGTNVLEEKLEDFMDVFCTVKNLNNCTQLAFAFSNETMEIPEQCLKYIQS